MIPKNRGHYKKVLNDFTVSKALRKRGKSNEYFENILSRLTIEELVALKIEVSMRDANTAFMGLPIYRNITRMAKCGALLAAIGASSKISHPYSILGMNSNEFKYLVKKYNILKYFDEEVIRMLKEEEAERSKKGTQNELDNSKDV